MEQKKILEPWIRHMLDGEFEEVWKLRDVSLDQNQGKPCWHLPRHLQYSWNGSQLEGKRVLIRCYHGLGDTIQFVRYASLLRQIASEVIVWAQADLLPVLQTVQGIDLLLPLHDGAPDVDYDVDVEIMELPHIFRTTLNTIPATVPYIHADPMAVTESENRRRIGLVWQAGDWDSKRSIPFRQLAPLFEIKAIDIHILQSDANAAGWQEGMGIHPGAFSLPDYARFIKGLDLLISVDSMPVHLAGALGMPVWNLLQAEADWRWMADRDDSPWYPSMRLFRQQRQGEWHSVIDQVSAALKKLSF